MNRYQACKFPYIDWNGQKRNNCHNNPRKDSSKNANHIIVQMTTVKSFLALRSVSSELLPALLLLLFPQANSSQKRFLFYLQSMVASAPQGLITGAMDRDGSGAPVTARWILSSCDRLQVSWRKKSCLPVFICIYDHWQRNTSIPLVEVALKKWVVVYIVCHIRVAPK